MLTLNASIESERNKLSSNKLEKERGRDIKVIERSEREGF